MSEITRVSVPFGRESLILETGKLAKQSDAAVLVQYGGTVVLVTVVGSREMEEGQDFFPLTCDYREKTYAAGKIPGGYFKREGKPTEKEVLTSRLMDRPIRPMFPDEYFNEVQIMATVLSVDAETNPDILAMIGASAALTISPIPFAEPIAAIRVGYIDGQYVVNPTYAQLEKSKLDLILAASKENIAMIESGSNEISEDEMIKAIEFGHKSLQPVIELQKKMISQVGKKKWEALGKKIAPDITKKIEKICEGKFDKINLINEKEARQTAIDDLYKEVLAQFDKTAEGFCEIDIKFVYHEIESREVRNLILKKKKRPDGRSFKDIRPISCEIGLLPRTHGSALFTRGQTQSLCVATLGTSADEQMIDALEGEYYKRFMLHYNFPPFSVGEIGPNRGPGRREVGHGALAERALRPMMPTQDEFPYTVRIVSDILESNGSSSMATVCGGTLSLMDAGVPLKAPVAGIAMGLVKQDNDFAVLTDIQGVEDHLGDMDFKVAGTRKGINALQMDIKIKGLTPEIMKQALAEAYEARMKILDIMEKTISTPRKELSVFAPRITTLIINPEKIKNVIGPGGKVIKKIIEETGVKIDISDDGKVLIASSDSKAAEMAIGKIKALTEEVEVGKIYYGKVRKIMNFGAFCEIIPGTDGLVHVSEIAEGFVKNAEDHLKVGDVVAVKVIGIDASGKINLSAKQAKKELGITQDAK
ncbi:MAG: polyribonucleotide nucleotidyltransferase [Candidatus Omnitrophica bacterium]|nr:polyribonucleotide nucleotidyltransferase [Candidatus Omnitrophota bacterium]